MKVDPSAADRSAPIDLARQAGFALGPASVRPPLSEVMVAGQTIKLQPRVMQVLVALVRADSEVVSRDELIASCWGGLAIGDDAINRCIGRLRRLAEDEAPGSFAIETLPRIGYRLTPVGGVATLALPGSRPRRFSLIRLGLGCGAFAVLAIGVWVATGRPGYSQTGQGVAVIPFDTAPGDPFARSFADGVTDKVASDLTTASVKSLPTGEGSAATGARDAIAGRLGAAFALSGRVQHVGDLLAVNVTVDDPQRHELLWSADFSRPTAQAQVLQEQVAAKTADVLHCALDANNYQSGRIDPDSLRLYLRACDLMAGDNMPEVRDLFRRVTAREPGFANAWANFAMASQLAAQKLPPDQASAARQDAHAAAEHALQLDPKCGTAYFALSLAIQGSDHLLERQALLQKGLTVQPDNARLNYREAELLSEAGRYDEAVAYARRAVTLNPLLPFYTSDLAAYLAQDGRLAEARTVIERARRIWPDDDDMMETRIAIEARYGDPALALTLLDDPKSRPADWEDRTIDDWRQFTLARQSRVPSVIAAYAKVVLGQLAAGQLDFSGAILRLSSLGATDSAYAAASRATPANFSQTQVLFRPPAEDMRRDPRFMPLAARLGLVDFWERSGHWPDFCESPARPYDCRSAAASLER